VLQISKQPGRRTCAGLTVTVRRHLDGTFTIVRGLHTLGAYGHDGTPVVAPDAPQMSPRRSRRHRPPTAPPRRTATL
jgi:hypothetical protein